MLPQRKSNRLKYYDYNSCGAYFITICTANRNPILAEIRKGNETERIFHTLLPCGIAAVSVIDKLSERFPIHLSAYVMMPDHVHLLFWLTDDQPELRAIHESPLQETVSSETERAMVCPQCNNTLYPQIAPAVIVALVNEDKILLTRYAHGPYKRYALIAGYTEIGETIEETVVREVMEETGIKAKNLRYYASQPWPFSGSVLMGYIADVDGSDEIKLDRNELCEGVWMKREEVEADENPKSITNQMIRDFKMGKF